MPAFDMLGTYARLEQQNVGEHRSGLRLTSTTYYQDKSCVEEFGTLSLPRYSLLT